MTTGIRGVATLAAISDSAVREQGPGRPRRAGRLAAAARRLAVVRAAGRRRPRGAWSRTSSPTPRSPAGPRAARRAGCVEGIALYVSGDRRVGAAARYVAGDAGGVSRRALTLTGLSAPGAIGRLGGDGQSAAYAYSSAAAFYIAERFGRKRFLRLYDAFNDPELTEPEGAELTAAAVRARSASRCSSSSATCAAGSSRARSSTRSRPNLDRPMPELPEVETIRRNLAPHVEGRTLERLEILDPRWSRPLAPRELADAVEGRAVERLGRRGKYLIWELEGEAYLLVHLRMTGTLLLDPDEPAHNRVWFELGRPPARVHRPAPLRHRRAGARRGRARRVPRRAARRRAARRRLHRPSTCYGLARALARADQGVPARPEARRRRRQHLRRRGAVPRAHPPAAARRTGSRARSARRCATRSSPRWRPGSRPRAPRSTTSATPTASAGPSRTSS